MWQQMVLEQLQDGYKISLIYMYTSSFQNAVWADCKESKKRKNIIYWLVFFDPVILQQVSGLQRCLQSEYE